MLPYFITFALCCIMTYFAEINEEKNKRKKAKFLLGLSIVPLLFTAGLRVADLGHDMNLYGIATFRSASMRGFFEVIPFLKNTYNLEKGFFIYVFLLTRIFNNINFMMFGLQLIVSICFIVFCYYYRKKTSMTMMMFIYCCTLYAFSYNILRQSIALGLFLIAILFYDKKKKLLSLLTLLLASTFHTSIVFSLVAFMVIYLCDNKKIRFKYKIILIIFTIFLTLFGLLFYQRMIDVAYKLGIIGSRFVSYGYETSSNFRDKINIEYSLLGLKTYCMFLTFLYFSCKSIPKNEKQENIKWLVMLIIDYIITFLSFKLANTDRISWYLYYPATFIFLPQTVKIFKNDPRNQLLGNIVVGIIFFIYIIEKFVTNQYAICPYRWIL